MVSHKMKFFVWPKPRVVNSSVFYTNNCYEWYQIGPNWAWETSLIIIKDQFDTIQGDSDQFLGRDFFFAVSYRNPALSLSHLIFEK